MFDLMNLTVPRVEREWIAGDLGATQVETLLLRFKRLSDRLQIAVLLELELLWTEDAGTSPVEVEARWIERAREYGLFGSWLALIDKAELHPAALE